LRPRPGDEGHFKSGLLYYDPAVVLRLTRGDARLSSSLLSIPSKIEIFEMVMVRAIYY
jgi:hypothetical protein